MRRGALVIDPPEATLLVQRGLTVAASGYNAFYFATYRLRNGRHRLGAVVLALINLALVGESVAFGLLPRMLADMGRELTTAGQLLAVSLTMATLILRQKMKRR